MFHAAEAVQVSPLGRLSHSLARFCEGPILHTPILPSTQPQFAPLRISVEQVCLDCSTVLTPARGLSFTVRYDLN